MKFYKFLQSPVVTDWILTISFRNRKMSRNVYQNYGKNEISYHWIFENENQLLRVYQLIASDYLLRWSNYGVCVSISNSNQYYVLLQHHRPPSGSEFMGTRAWALCNHTFPEQCPSFCLSDFFEYPRRASAGARSVLKKWKKKRTHYQWKANDCLRKNADFISI